MFLLQHWNLSAEILVLQRELLCAVNELASANGTDATPVPIETTSSPLGTLVQLLQNRDAKQAIQTLRTYRNRNQNKAELYGCCEDEDVEVLLLLHCKATAENQSSKLFPPFIHSFIV